MGMRVVRPEPLTADAFQPFGQSVMPGLGAAPDISGPTWDCWYPIGRVDGSRPLELGLVEARLPMGPVSHMERHEGRAELVIALDTPILQVVAPATSGSQPPDADSVRAFILAPGAAIVMSPGTWHAAAAPLADSPARYMFGLPQPDESAVDSGWTLISDGGVAVDLPLAEDRNPLPAGRPAGDRADVDR
jgi:ureidoglycolate hydrolase